MMSVELMEWATVIGLKLCALVLGFAVLIVYMAENPRRTN